MNIDATRTDVAEIIRTLESELDETRRIADCEAFDYRARKRLEDVRKNLQRTIDERLLGRPGTRRFTVNEREAIQDRLNKLVSDAHSKIDELVVASRNRIAEQSVRP